LQCNVFAGLRCFDIHATGFAGQNLISVKISGQTGFAPKIFGVFNWKVFRFLKFRAENFSARELSIQKNPGGRNFIASVPGSIGRAGISVGSCV
jgi:hypothetical protein